MMANTKGTKSAPKTGKKEDPKKPDPKKTGKVSKPAVVKKKKERKVLPKNVRKLIAHRSTRHIWSRLRRVAKKKGVQPESLLKKKPRFVVKKIGGEKNGGKRLVLKKKGPKWYPTERRSKRRRVGHMTYKMHKRTLKQGLEPGKVLIILAGRHRGKRVVFLKQLPSGLLLINGPFKINACPLRRVHQNFVIVTSTKLDISGVKIPDHIDDKYFKAKKDKAVKGKKTEGGDIFDTKPDRYRPDEQRKKDQVDIDKQLIEVIRKHSEKKLMFAYLGSYFKLRNRMYPHKMKF